MSEAGGPLRPADSATRALEVLRIAVGAVWALNLLFVVLPAADFWDGFPAVAAGFGPSTPGGSAFASFVAAHPQAFAALIAVTTAYLAAAFLLGVSTRLACAIGSIFSVLLLWTQFGSTFAFPGGTDVGPHPLYLAIYAALFVGGAGRFWSIDGRLARWGRARRSRFARWLAAPSA